MIVRDMPQGMVTKCTDLCNLNIWIDLFASRGFSPGCFTASMLSHVNRRFSSVLTVPCKLVYLGTTYQGFPNGNVEKCLPESSVVHACTVYCLVWSCLVPRVQLCQTLNWYVNPHLVSRQCRLILGVSHCVCGM